MNSRERVLAALNHRQPDRPPVDLGGHRSSTIAASAYARLKKALGFTSGDIYVQDILMQMAIVEPEVRDALGLDVVELGRAFLLEDKDWKDWELPDGTPCKIPAYINRLEKRGDDWYLLSDDGQDLAVQKAGTLYFDQVHWPLADVDFEREDFPPERLREAFAHSMWTAFPTPGGHIPLTEDGLQQLAAGARALRVSTDRAIVGYAPGGSIFEIPQFLFGQEQYLMYMALYPEACVRFSESLIELYVEDVERWLTVVGPYVDVVMLNDDLGGQNGPLISPSMYRRYFKPCHQEMTRRVHEIVGAKTLLHTCGGIEPLLDDLIDAGLDAVNPVQISCKDMDARHLKAKFGDRITFWGGGCDTRDILPRGTPEEIRRHVREQVGILNAGGGFVFTQVHNIQADVPIENILAMYEAVREYWSH